MEEMIILLMQMMQREFPEAFRYETRDNSHWLGFIPQGHEAPRRLLHVSRGMLNPMFGGSGPFLAEIIDELVPALLPGMAPGQGVAIESPEGAALWHSLVTAALRNRGHLR